jgi:hypothetical protein
MACATSCTTQDHRTYGECLRSKGLSTAAGETTKASGPTQPNDALTAKATGADPQDDACYECPTDEFEWSDTVWIDGAPVMECRTHGHRAPGHVYEAQP